jgi:DNA-binding XRE family transcriptional regulator
MVYVTGDARGVGLAESRTVRRVRPAPRVGEHGYFQVPNLRAARLRSNLTQGELARRSGVSEATVNKLERGKHKAQAKTIRRLAEAMGCPVSEIVRPPLREEEIATVSA